MTDETKSKRGGVRLGAGRPKGSTRGRSPRVYISLDLTPDMRDVIDAAARAKGMTRAGWIKEAIAHWLAQANFEK